MLRVVIAIAPLLISCISERTPEEGFLERNSELDDEIVEVVADYRAFDQVSVTPYGSELGAYDIAVYSTFATPLYRMIHPEDPGSKVRMPPGSIIVREVLDARGEVAKLTIMAKGPPGFDPRLGDWWFGVTDPRGEPLVVDGVVQLGRMTECHACHLPRITDDYLFGVPTQGR